MKKLYCIFKDEKNVPVYCSFYGDSADKQATDFMCEHNNYRLISAYICFM